MVLTDAIITFNGPGPFAPTLTADQLIYEPGHRVTGEHGHLGLGDWELIPLPEFSQSFDESLIPHFTSRAGFRRNLGAFFDLGLQVPVAPGFNLGGDLDVYTARGVMFGPAGSYQYQSGDEAVTGTFSSGFISDHGDRGTDLLGRPVPVDRGYVEWSHQQSFNDGLTLTGQFNWWQDSDVLRDFRPSQFYPVQQPDSFLEAVYAGDNYTSAPSPGWIRTILRWCSSACRKSASTCCRCRSAAGCWSGSTAALPCCRRIPS